MRSAAVFALPSHSENFGNAVLEAMACGCPVVVTPDVGLARSVGEAGAGLVVHGEAKEIGSAISALISDPLRRNRMGESGKKLAAESFSWDRIAAQMEEAYEGCRGEGAERSQRGSHSHH
jgi:glycosyltransferase involved in cell wall biosynthesis